MKPLIVSFVSAGAVIGLASPVSAAQVDFSCTGTAPIVCQADVAPGHYQVSVRLGAGTTVQAESRRLMVGQQLEDGRRRFTLNVREPEGQPTGQGGTGTPGLTLTFGGPTPEIAKLKIKAAATSTPVIYLAGDSTVCDQPGAPYAGWGQALPRFFDRGLSVANYADSGENSATFLSDPTLAPTMLPLVHPGDLVLIQFGHNDKQTTAEDYRSNLTTLVSSVRAQGGVPVLVTPVVRRAFSGTSLLPVALHINGLGVDLPAEMRAVAAASTVPLIDLTAQTETLVEALGPEASKDLFLFRELRDNTHFSEHGAAVVSKLVLTSLLELGLVDDRHLSDEALG